MSRFEPVSSRNCGESVVEWEAVESVKRVSRLGAVLSRCVVHVTVSWREVERTLENFDEEYSTCLSFLCEVLVVQSFTLAHMTRAEFCSEEFE